GSKPARQGVRAGISGRLQVTNNWSAYGSYQVEARDSLVNQRVMLGVGYSF
ncbi:outer membrane insertion signal domain protein, partial [Akkermansia sp. KLE1605]